MTCEPVQISLEFHIYINNMETKAINFTRGWHDSTKEFCFQLSDKILFKTDLRMLMCQLSLTNPACSPADFPAFPEEKPTDIDGFIAWGAPINESESKIQISDELIVYIPERYNRYFTRLDQSFDEYKNTFKSKTRSGIQRKVNKFKKLCGGSIDFRAYSTANELKEFLTSVKQLSDKTYQTKLLDAGLPNDPGYHEDLLQKAAQNKVRAFLLYKDNQPISYLLLDAIGNTLIYRYLGYDPTESSNSPGTVLHWLALEYLTTENQFKYLDFTEGEGQQKRTFGTHSIHCANIYWLKKNMKNLALVYSQTALNQCSRSLGNLFDSLGLKAKLKKLIRNTA